MVAAIALLLTAQSDLVGEISRSTFLAELCRFGYSTKSGATPYEETLISGSDAVTIEITSGGIASAGPYVVMALLRADFDLPRYVEKARLRDWLEGQKLPGLTVSSYLGGKVALSGHLGDPKRSWDEVRANAVRFMEGFRRLRKELTPLKSVQARQVGEMGRAPLDLTDRVDSIHEVDIRYLRPRVGWGEPEFAVGGHGWYLAAKPLSVPIVLNGFNDGNLWLVAMTRRDPGKLDAWQRAASKDFEVRRYGERVDIFMKIDVSGGMTVGDLVNRVEKFARAVKSLNPTLDPPVSR